MNIFETIVNNLLLENCTNYGNKLEFVDNDPKKGFYVYHTTYVDKNDGIEIYKNIARVGFRRQHSGNGAGEMYGKGCYTTYNFLSSKINKKRGWYGSVIVKGICRINLKKMLIFDPAVSEQVYGKRTDIDEQLKLMFKGHENILAQMEQTNGRHPAYGHDGTLSDAKKYFRDSLSVNDGIYTSNGAQMAWAVIYTFQKKTKIKIVNRFVNGVIYSGGNDGNCCIPWNFSCIEPIAFTLDEGQTWHNIDRKDWVHDDLAHNYDLQDEIGDIYDYFRTEGFKDKFCVVGKQFGGSMKFRILNQIQFVNDRTNGKNSDGRISDLWFDEIYGSSFDMYNYIRVKYKGINLYLFKEKYNLYKVYDEQDHYLCNLNYLDTYLNNINNNTITHNNNIQVKRIQATDDELDNI